VSGTSFASDQARLDAARGLPLAQFDEFQRLTKSLLHGPAFQLVLVDCPQDEVRRDVSKRIDHLLAAEGLRVEHVQLDVSVPDAVELERRLSQLATSAQAVQVLGGGSWFDGPRLDDLNQRRERLAGLGLRLLFWLDIRSISQLAERAHDLWSWRAGVYSFAGVLPQATERVGFVADTRTLWDANVSMAQRHRRVARVKDMLAQMPPDEHELRAPLLRELTQLLYETGQVTEAINISRNQLAPLYQRLGDLRGQARALDDEVAALIERGDADAALRILQDEVQPLLNALQDERALAIAQSRIADVLKLRGDNAQAFAILSAHVLPVLQRLGDGPTVAATLGKMALALHHCGDSDQALRILQEQVLPLTDQLQQPHARALAMGAVADIAHDRGQIDEALRIRRDEQLPAFERLGDVRWRALTVLKMAEDLRLRGDVDEAIAMLRDQTVPVFERLGDVLCLAWARVGLAKHLLARGHAGDQAEAKALLAQVQGIGMSIGASHESVLAELLAKAHER
jgi:tetratricopeptide (TPR) repeat protein